jgi:hypothetical protein
MEPDNQDEPVNWLTREIESKLAKIDDPSFVREVRSLVKGMVNSEKIIAQRDKNISKLQLELDGVRQELAIKERDATCGSK